MRKDILRPSLIGCTVLLLVFLFLLSLMTGKYPLTLLSLLSGEEQAVSVFLTLRLPRALMGILGGFCLGLSGNVYQIIFHNPLASPDMIGVSSGAGTGAAFAILFISAASLPVTVSAFAGGMAAVCCTLALSSLAPHRGNAHIVLAGIAVSSLSQTALMVLKLTADPERELAAIEYWMMGSLNAITLSRLPAVLLFCIPCSIAIVLLHRHLLLLTLEEEEARMLGSNVRLMRLTLLVLATLLVAATVSVTGLISFIGLLAPHIARFLLPGSRPSSLFLSGLTGSVLLTGADILARGLTDAELPVSIFTSLLGAPFLLYLMFRKEPGL